MHDHMYRMGVAWQNVAYNQPPHLGYYLPDFIESFRGVSADEIKGIVSESQDATQVSQVSYYSLDGTLRNAGALGKGIYIERTQFADGHTRVRKIMIE